jgi:ribosomal protein S9
MDESLKPQLRSYGLLTRDSRVKERKKYGLRRLARPASTERDSLSSMFSGIA